MLCTSEFGFRHYNPVTGRWPSRDPIGEQGGINLYAYVRNEPVGRIDYLGLELKKFKRSDAIILDVREEIKNGELPPPPTVDGRELLGLTTSDFKTEVAKCEVKDGKCTVRIPDATLWVNTTYYKDGVDKKGRGVVEHEDLHIDVFMEEWNTLADVVNPYDGKEYKRAIVCREIAKRLNKLAKAASDRATERNEKIDAESY